MSDSINKSRRNALKLAAGAVVAVPLSMLTTRQAFADALPHVDAAGPAAVALKYVEDATTAERADKAGTAGDQQTCVNCQFATSKDGDWLPCQLFPGQSVAAKGWCSAWSLTQ